jgi:hypothetical protein
MFGRNLLPFHLISSEKVKMITCETIGRLL